MFENFPSRIPARRIAVLYGLTMFVVAAYSGSLVVASLAVGGALGAAGLVGGIFGFMVAVWFDALGLRYFCGSVRDS